jgi:hypothetical protein
VKEQKKEQRKRGKEQKEKNKRTKEKKKTLFLFFKEKSSLG